jgi:hypothetical protein
MTESPGAKLIVHGEAVSISSPVLFKGKGIDRRRLEPKQARLFDYWSSIATTDERFPHYERFDVLDVPDLLGDLSVLEVHRPKDEPEDGAAIRFRFRLYGTRVQEARGKDLTGHWADEKDAFSPHVQQQYLEAFATVVDSGEPLLQIFPCHLRNRRSGTYLRLHLPFWSTAPNMVDRIVISFLVV